MRPCDLHLSRLPLCPVSAIATAFCGCCTLCISRVTSLALHLLWSHLSLCISRITHHSWHRISRVASLVSPLSLQISCGCISSTASLGQHLSRSHFLQSHLCSYIFCSLSLQAWAWCKLRFGWLDTTSVYFPHTL